MSDNETPPAELQAKREARRRYREFYKRRKSGLTEEELLQHAAEKELRVLLKKIANLEKKVEEMEPLQGQEHWQQRHSYHFAQAVAALEEKAHKRAARHVDREKKFAARRARKLNEQLDEMEKREAELMKTAGCDIASQEKISE